MVTGSKKIVKWCKKCYKEIKNAKEGKQKNGGGK